jgi:hypothetical protein
MILQPVRSDTNTNGDPLFSDSSLPPPPFRLVVQGFRLKVADAHSKRGFHDAHGVRRHLQFSRNGTYGISAW